MTESKPSSEFVELKRVLQAFQSARLNDTYADLKEDPQYAKIGIFFFEKLYAPQDFSFRDESIKRLQRVLQGKIYRGVVSAVSLVIELHQVTEREDDRMVAAMLAAGIGPDFDLAQYSEIYRSLDNYDVRIHQIELSLKATRVFHKLSRKLIVAISLNTIRSTARILGMGRIFNFIHEGYSGFRAIKNIDYFVDTIGERERAWHERMWAGDATAPN